MKKVLFGLVVTLASVAAFGEEAGAAVAGSTAFFNVFTKAAIFPIAVALAAFGGATGQSRAAAAALEGIARNPSAVDKIMTPMILCLALMESLVIFTLISVFLV